MVKRLVSVLGVSSLCLLVGAAPQTEVVSPERIIMSYVSGEEISSLHTNSPNTYTSLAFSLARSDALACQGVDEAHFSQIADAGADWYLRCPNLWHTQADLSGDECNADERLMVLRSLTNRALARGCAPGIASERARDDLRLLATRWSALGEAGQPFNQETPDPARYAALAAEENLSAADIANVLDIALTLWVVRSLSEPLYGVLAKSSGAGTIPTPEEWQLGEELFTHGVNEQAERHRATLCLQARTKLSVISPAVSTQAQLWGLLAYSGCVLPERGAERLADAVVTHPRSQNELVAAAFAIEGLNTHIVVGASWASARAQQRSSGHVLTSEEQNSHRPKWSHLARIYQRTLNNAALSSSALLPSELFRSLLELERHETILASGLSSTEWTRLVVTHRALTLESDRALYLQNDQKPSPDSIGLDLATGRPVSLGDATDVRTIYEADKELGYLLCTVDKRLDTTLEGESKIPLPGLVEQAIQSALQQNPPAIVAAQLKLCGPDEFALARGDASCPEGLIGPEAKVCTASSEGDPGLVDLSLPWAISVLSYSAAHGGSGLINDAFVTYQRITQERQPAPPLSSSPGPTPVEALLSAEAPDVKRSPDERLLAALTHDRILHHALRLYGRLPATEEEGRGERDAVRKLIESGREVVARTLASLALEDLASMTKSASPDRCKRTELAPNLFKYAGRSLLLSPSSASALAPASPTESTAERLRRLFANDLIARASGPAGIDALGECSPWLMFPQGDVPRLHLRPPPAGKIVPAPGAQGVSYQLNLKGQQPMYHPPRAEKRP